MRGKVRNVLKSIIIQRITPAYAGKRKALDRADDRKKDHPRLCGEKLLVYTPKTP